MAPLGSPWLRRMLAHLSNLAHRHAAQGFHLRPSLNVEPPKWLLPPPSARRRRRVLSILWLSIAVVIFLFVSFGLYHRLSNEEIGPEINLGYATYRGNYLSNGISEFLGMRFAEPPLGDLRWRAPVDPKPVHGVQRAKKFGPLCLGISVDPSRYFDEDCLFVNVWAPTNATADMKLPVMVFIQGGGYTVLANGNWNGSQLVETAGRDLVFVNFNYRVGLWGFLAGEEVRRDGNLNAGLLDQAFLLQWVQTHISKFGGDPDHVIIQGISAGAGSVALHLASYGGQDRGLFVGAIAESIFFPAQPYLADLEWQYDRTIEAAGCSEADDRMSCLRNKSKKALQRINRPSPFPSQTINPLFYWTPCIDGEFLEDLPYHLFESGRFIKVPLLAGACTNEGSVFAPPNARSPRDMTNFLRINYPKLRSWKVDEIVDLYPLEPRLANKGAWFPSSSRAYGDATFICPTNNILEAYTSPNASNASNAPSHDQVPMNPSQLWSYRYNVVDQIHAANGLGVPHVFEAPAVFGPGMLPPGAVAPSYWSYNAPIVPQVMSYWLSFARTLDPNTFKRGEDPVWEPWGLDRQRLVIDLAGSLMELTPGDEMERCEYWSSLANFTRQ
ncbi:Alpha/Beta hydrolase protein [Stachybotrys elegans]|uniref:Carboxylic ester hydrolase n=1 Tax=Stachybotrys elegans TaxID=80388 RepID=A0A8K0T2Q8_9HYPO|nr:Alpha/Beta hydrolase protein [Stachybotrys elegans]